MTKSYAIRCTTEEQARECEKSLGVNIHSRDKTKNYIIYDTINIGWYSEEWNFIRLGYTIITYDEAISLGLLGEKDYTADEQMEINDMLNEEPQKEYPYYKDEHGDIVIHSRNNPVKESRLATQRIKYPVKDDGQGMYIFDEKGSMICQIRGWGELQKQSNGIEIQDDVAKFISEAINEKLSKESPSEDISDLLETVRIWTTTKRAYGQIENAIKRHLSSK